MRYEVEPIGYVESTRKEAFDDAWDSEQAAVVLDATRFEGDCLAGLEAFSHVVVLFLMDRVQPEKVVSGARHPRNDPRLPKVGIFAQRGKNRPNRLGVTVCRVLSVAGLRVELAGLDAIDGTPVLDLKPWFASYGPRGEAHEPPWVAELLRSYW